MCAGSGFRPTHTIRTDVRKQLRRHDDFKAKLLWWLLWNDVYSYAFDLTYLSATHTFTLTQQTHATNTHWPFTAPDRAPAISQSEGSRPSPRPHCTQSCPVGIIQSSGSKFTGIWWKKVPEVMSWEDREETEKRNTSHPALSVPRLDVVGHKIFHNSASHYPRSVYMCVCVSVGLRLIPVQCSSQLSVVRPDNTASWLMIHWQCV